MKRIFTVITTTLCLLYGNASYAQIDTRGTDFWLSFGDNAAIFGPAALDNLHLQIRLVADAPATGTITFTESGEVVPFSVGASSVTTFPLTPAQRTAAYQSYNGAANPPPVTSNKSVRVQSDVPISVYALNQYQALAEATGIYPAPTLGTDYYHLGRRSNLTFANNTHYDMYYIVATQNGTDIFENGVQVATNLSAGQVYCKPATFQADLTGRHVTSNNPVAYFTAHNYCGINGGGDNFFQQLSSVNTWGKTFLVPVTNRELELVRVIAAENGTVITVSNGTIMPVGGGQSTLNLGAGQWVELLIRLADNGCYIQSNNPVQVASYMVGNAYGNGVVDPDGYGDESQTAISPIEQTIKSALIAPFVVPELITHFAMIVTPTATKDNTTVSINGAAPVPVTSLGGGVWYDNPDGSGMSFYSGPLAADANTSYLFENNAGLIVYAYGYGDQISYYYQAASAMRTLDAGFYVNDIYYTDLDEDTVCGTLEFRAELSGDLSTVPGFLKWYIDGVEEIAARDQQIWYGNLPGGTYQIRMVALMANSVTTKTVEGTLHVAYDQANNDYVQTFVNTPVDVSVFDNDSLGCCGPSGVEKIITTNGVHGTASITGYILTYTPALDFVGKDSVTYAYNCSGTTHSAKVYITVVPLPDNISDADCYIDAPPTVWDIEIKTVTDVPVYFLATPWIGDLDRDGRNEVVVPNTGNNDLSTGMLIFDDGLQLKSSFSTPDMPEYGTMTNLIADVDNDGFGEIVVVTMDKYLECYDMNGFRKWRSSDVISFRSLTEFCPSPIVADINSDGYPEILALDNIFDGTTGRLVAGLSAGGGRGRAAGGPYESYMPVFADMDGDGLQEVVAGNTVYKVNITNRAGTAGNTVSVLSQINLSDGFTSVADIDLDGDLDVVVTGAVNDNNKDQNQALFYVWDGDTPAPIGNPLQFASAESRISRAFIGDIDGDGSPEVAFTYVNNIEAYSFNGAAFTQMFRQPTTDASGATTMSMFDFNLDGEVELVYRDQDSLRIIGKDGFNRIAFSCRSATHTEYPVVVDLDSDGSADILVSGGIDGYSGTRIIRYGSITPGAWAPARSVWNQHAYNATNINEDLSVPQYPMNNATVFPGEDGIPGTADDLRPFNNFLQQQTVLDHDGLPIWLVPDVETNPSLVQTTLFGDSLTVTVKFFNKGDAAIGAPVYVSLYRETPSPQSYGVTDLIATDSADVQMFPGDTAEVIFKIPDITAFFPMANLVVRLNDDGKTFPVQPECEYVNDTVTVPNPAIYLMMKKNASLFGVPDNGKYPNPVSVLFNDTILYEITAVNASTTAGNVMITDTLPPYMDYAGNATHSATINPPSGTPPRRSIVWTVGLAPLASVTVSFEATPVSGAVASQPLLINKAWVKIPDNNVAIPTNSTYHQGAGVAVVTFSASIGGWIFNAGEQALDYRTTPRSGIQIVPEEGYEFTGWSYDSYTSLRGEIIPADSSVMNYEDIVIQGNVELRANFVPISSDRYIGTVENEEISKPETDKVWTVDDNLYVTPAKAGSVLRIYTVEGVLREQHALVSEGTSTYKLPRGVYIVTVNNGRGRKIASLP